MYHMRNIVSLEEQSLSLPKCMYRLKDPIAECSKNESDISISDQKMPNTQLIELEDRQDKLLLKLDILYERIRNISSLCLINNVEETKHTSIITNQEEIVIVLNPNILPWFLNKFVKQVPSLNISWHIHSSVPTEKISKIKAFFKKYHHLYTVQQDAKINLRLIFKGESTLPELKISSLTIPICGAVNIMRYLCQTYDNVVPYDYYNYQVEALLDVAYQIEAGSDENKTSLISNIFSDSNEWIYKDTFSIVDLAIFNIINQTQQAIKCVPKNWFNNCEKLIL